jgi:hypothetical protein
MLPSTLPSVGDRSVLFKDAVSCEDYIASVVGVILVCSIGGIQLMAEKPVPVAFHTSHMD